MNWDQDAFRQQAWVNYRRREAKLALFKAGVQIGLIILICAGTLSVLYALNW